MKKKKLITLCIAAVAVILGYGGMKAYKNVGNNNLMLANVEAFTQGDEPSAKSWPCWSELKKGDGVWLCGAPCRYLGSKNAKGGEGMCTQ